MILVCPGYFILKCHSFVSSDEVLMTFYLKLHFSRYYTHIDFSMFFCLEKTWNTNNSITKQWLFIEYRGSLS